MRRVLRHVRRWAAILALVYCVYALLVLFVVPPVARHLLVTKLGQALGRTVSVEAVFLNPFTLCVQVRQLEVYEADGVSLFAGFRRLRANLDLFWSVLQRGAVVSEVTLEAPHAVVVRLQDGSLDLSDLMARDRSGPTPEPTRAPAGVPRFSVNNIRIRDGWFYVFDDRVGACHRVTGLTLAVGAVSSLPSRIDVVVVPELRAVFNGREIVVAGQAKPFAASREGTVSLGLHGLDLTHFAPYLPPERNFQLRSGRLDIDVTVSHVLSSIRRPTLSVTGEVVLADLWLDDRAGQALVGLGELRVGILPADLLSKEVHLGKVTVAKPFVRLQRDASGALILPTVGAAPSAAPAAPPPPATGAAPGLPVRVDVDEVAVEEGRVEFSDASVAPAFHAALDLRLKAQQLSTRPDTKASVELALTSDAGETIEGAYSVGLFPLAVSGTTAVTGVPLPRYMPYVRPVLAGEITAGTFAIRLQHALSMGGSGAPVITVSDLDAVLTGVALKAEADGAEAFSLGELRIEDVSADVGQRQAVVGRLATSAGSLRVRRGPDGALNLQRLLRAAPAGTGAAAAPARPAGTPPDGAQPPAAAPWSVTLREATVARWTVDFTDQPPAGPVHLALHDITLAAKEVSTQAGTRAALNLSVGINETGTLVVDGAVVPTPLEADVTVKLAGLELRAFQPYLAQFANVVLTAGNAATDLHAVVRQSAADGLSGTVEGGIAVREVASQDSLRSEDLVRCKELAINGIHLDVKPLAVHLDEIAVDGLAGAITLRPDRTLNVAQVARQEASALPGQASAVPEAAPAVGGAPAQGSAFPLDIGTVRLNGCDVVFTDQTVNPHYRIELGEIAASVKDFSLAKPTPTAVSLSAMIDGHAPFAVSATLTDIANPRTLTLQASTALKDFDLSPLTPYAGHYVGYAVQKGKLNLDLRYDINQRKLAAAHSLLVDQFAFGQKVESPEATDLPVRLAVALLKDRKGQIRFDVPVSGDLDDPKFSVLRIVLKVVRDLVAKAATAPFAMLGALVGGGEELSVVEFAPGVAALDEAGTARMRALAKALAERPELGVELCGSVDPEQDRDALVRQEVERRVRARKLADLVKAGQPAIPVGDVVLSDTEFERYLRLVDSEAQTPPAAPQAAPVPPASAAAEKSTAAGPAAPPPAPTTPPEPPLAEVESRVRATVQISADDVRLLARQRATRVQEFLVNEGQIEAPRVFVVDRLDAKASDAAAKASLRRVQLSLR